MRTVPLKRLATLRAGGTPSVDEPTYWADDGLAWVSIGDMTTAPIVCETSRRISEAGLRASRLSVAPPGTLLFAMYASVGEVAMLGVSAVWNQAIVGIEPRTGMADSRFLRYALVAAKPTFLSVTRSNTQPNLNADQVSNLPIPMVSSAAQRAIADFLDAETARIDFLLNARQQMVRLMQERRESVVSDELARSSRGGDRIRLKYLCGLPTSGNRDHAALQDEGVPCLRGFNVRPGRIDRRELLCISDADNKRHADTVLRTGDVVIVRSGNAGSAACIPVDLDGCNCVDLVVVRRTPKLIPRFLELVLNSEITVEQVRQRSSGAILNHFNAVDAAELRVPLVDLETQRDVVARLDQRTAVLESIVHWMLRQIALLQERRQALITAAVSGELDLAQGIAVEAS